MQNSLFTQLKALTPTPAIFFQYSQKRLTTYLTLPLKFFFNTSLKTLYKSNTYNSHNFSLPHPKPTLIRDSFPVPYV